MVSMAGTKGRKSVNKERKYTSMEETRYNLKNYSTFISAADVALKSKKTSTRPGCVSTVADKKSNMATFKTVSLKSIELQI